MLQGAINKKTKLALESLNKILTKENFYLAGGTALALQLNHRQSIDLDFFCQKDFSTAKLKNELAKISKFKVVNEAKGTLTIIFNGVKLSFFHYPYSLLFSKLKFDDIFMADWRDIACMKINAISGRGSKKDFIDLFFILGKISLSVIFELFDKKFKKIDYNKLHILKSLVFFEDAAKEPMPIMLERISWLKVKKCLIEKVKEYSREK